MTDLLPEITHTDDGVPEGITLDELRRIAQLQRGLKILQDELKELSDKAKLAFTQAGIAGKVTKVYGKLVVQLGEQNRIDAPEKAALTEAYPLAEYPDWYSAMIDLTKVPAEIADPFRKPVVTLSVRDTDAPQMTKPKRAND